jgi:hypothetical protein
LTDAKEYFIADWETGEALLKAIAAKLIPDIPEETRIVILQQTDLKDVDADERSAASANDEGPGLSVLEEVKERATSKQELEKEIASK